MNRRAVGSAGGVFVGVLAAATLGLLPTPVARGQCEPAWVNISGADAPRMFAAAAYDEARRQVVVFGGTGVWDRLGDTMVWDGDQWRTVANSGPSPRTRPGMAYDAARERVVLFGGNDARDRADTWLWDGASWTPIAAPGPTAPTFHAMAYDRERGVVVYSGNSFIGGQETWEWDGSAWVFKEAGFFPRQSGYRLAFDPSRQQVIKYSGETSTASVFAWDGATWIRVLPDGPGARSDHAMVTDLAGGRVLVYGGYSDFRDTSAWTGTSWVQLTTGFPYSRAGMFAAFDDDRGAFLIGGGREATGTGGAILPETYVYDGAAWERMTGPEVLRRRGHAAAFDRQRGVTVLFGGVDGSGALLGDTIEWAGGAWNRVSTAGPGPRRGAAMVADPAGGVLLFGGRDAAGPRGDLWRWNGAAWMLVSAGGPIAREDHALALDTQRGRVVLFGGLSAGGALDDTWEWDGAAWSPVIGSGPRPTPRSGHAMAYDPGLGRIVLCGGDPFGETWEWDGAAWSLAGVATPPLASTALVYDEAAARLTRFGGMLTTGPLTGEMSRYAGAGQWTSIATPGAPPARAGHVMVFDALRRAVITAGGQGAAGALLNDAHAYRFTDGPIITREPEPVAVAEGRTAEFTVEVFARTPQRRYTWHRNGVALQVSDRVSGVNSARLVIRDVTAADADLYGCEVYDSCTSYPTRRVELTVRCAADLTGDGFVDFGDYLEFLNLYDQRHADADFNADGLVDFADYLEFLNRYEAGC